jgi:hypothetical protein
MIARYLAATALLLVLVAGCDMGTTTTPPVTTPPVNANPADASKKVEIQIPEKASGIKPL